MELFDPRHKKQPVTCQTVSSVKYAKERMRDMYVHYSIVIIHVCIFFLIRIRNCKLVFFFVLVFDNIVNSLIIALMES